MSQLLSTFQSAFGTDAVRIEMEQFARDGAFSEATIDALKDAGFDAVYFKPLTSEQRDAFEASVAGIDGKRDLGNLRARLVALSWTDEDGAPVGTAKEIGQLRADLVGALFTQAQSLNGMGVDLDAEKND